MTKPMFMVSDPIILLDYINTESIKTLYKTRKAVATRQINGTVVKQREQSKRARGIKRVGSQAIFGFKDDETHLGMDFQD